MSSVSDEVDRLLEDADESREFGVPVRDADRVAQLLTAFSIPFERAGAGGGFDYFVFPDRRNLDAAVRRVTQKFATQIAADADWAEWRTTA